MTMMKYGEIYSLYDALTRLKDVTGFKVAWAVAKNLKILEPEAQFFEEQRVKLVKKYGKEENGNYAVIPGSEGFEDFTKEFAELAGMESDVELYKIKGDVTEKDFSCDTAKASDFVMLLDYLVDDKTEEKDG